MQKSAHVHESQGRHGCNALCSSVTVKTLLLLAFERRDCWQIPFFSLPKAWRDSGCCLQNATCRYPPCSPSFLCTNKLPFLSTSVYCTHIGLVLSGIRTAKGLSSGEKLSLMWHALTQRNTVCNTCFLRENRSHRLVSAGSKNCKLVYSCQNFKASFAQG